MVPKTRESEQTTAHPWRTISEEICAAQRFPLGFRIALICDNRAVRDDVIVRVTDGYTAIYPDGLRVRAFLEEFAKDEINPYNPNLIFDELILKSHHNRVIHPDTRLWAVKDMAGNPDNELRTIARLAMKDRRWRTNRMAAMREVAENHPSRKPSWRWAMQRYIQDWKYSEIENKVMTIIEELTDDYDLQVDEAERTLPRCIIEALFDKFEPRFIEYVLQKYSDPKLPFSLSERYHKK